MRSLTPPDEETIISTWEKNAAPLVSVTIISYNHEKFIESAINGALAQITDFSIEIIIYDDASLDGTQEIIKKYAQKYPGIIVPLLQEENQWLEKKVNGTVVIAWPSAKGKYIAWLEGDDFWTDPLKLQKQVDFLESHEEYVACFTGATILNEMEGTSFDFMKYFEEGDVSLEKIIEIGGSIYPTSSFVFRNNVINKDLLDYLLEYLAGDTTLIIAAGMSGKVFFLNENTTVYRRWVGGLYSSVSKDPRAIARWKQERLNGFKKLRGITGGNLRRVVRQKISSESLYILRNSDSVGRFYCFFNLTGSDILTFIVHILLGIKNMLKSFIAPF